jgi:hypothetical protein
MTSSQVQSVIISFALLAAIEPVYVVDDSADKSVGGTWYYQQILNYGHTTIREGMVKHLSVRNHFNNLSLTTQTNIRPTYQL